MYVRGSLDFDAIQHSRILQLQANRFFVKKRVSFGHVRTETPEKYRVIDILGKWHKTNGQTCYVLVLIYKSIEIK